MTDVLRIFGNRGAHAASKEVKPVHTLAIDDFFRAVVEYVYVAPSKLSEFHKSLQGFDSKIRTGKLVKTEDDMVHYVGKESLIGIPDLATFNSWGFNFSQVLPANNAEKILPKQGILPTKKQGFADPLEQMAGNYNESHS